MPHAICALNIAYVYVLVCVLCIVLVCFWSVCLTFVVLFVWSETVHGITILAIIVLVCICAIIAITKCSISPFFCRLYTWKAVFWVHWSWKVAKTKRFAVQSVCHSWQRFPFQIKCRISTHQHVNWTLLFFQSFLFFSLHFCLFCFFILFFTNQV